MKIAVYCYITNNINNKPWPEITFKDKDVDYFMFTDDVKDGEEERNGWKLVKVDTERQDMLKEDMNKFYKWHPYDYLKGYDYSLYMDSKVVLLKNPMEIVTSLKGKIKHGFITHKYDYSPLKYPQHKLNYIDVYKHIDYLVDAGVGNIPNLKKWKSKLDSYKFPHNGGLLENAVILTDLHSEEGRDLQDRIFKKYKEVNTTRDQVVVPYVIWRLGMDINEFNGMGNYIHKSPWAKNTSNTNINNRDYSDKKYR